MIKVTNFIMSLVLLSVVIVLIDCTKASADEPWIAKVNGESISNRLFYQQMMKNRASVYGLFSAKYEIKDYRSFWSKTFSNGETPSDVLKKKTMDDCIAIVVQQEIAKKKGIINDISYNSFLDELEKVNESRKNAVGNKKIVYGPVEYNEGTYFDHIFSMMIVEVKNKLAIDEFVINDDILKSYYLNKRDEQYRKSKENKKDVYYLFDEIKSTVRSNYIDDQYNSYLKSKISSAKIQYNEIALEQIKVE